MPKFKIVKQIGDTFVTERGGRNNKFLADDDQIYSTWSKRFPELIGKETEYEFTGKEYQGVKEVRLGSGGWKKASRNGDPRTYALGSSARIVASMVQALDPSPQNIEKVKETWNKFYEFAIAKVSDSPKSGTVPEGEGEEKLPPFIESIEKGEGPQGPDLEIQIQEAIEKTGMSALAAKRLEANCATKQDYLTLLRKLAGSKE